MAMYVSAWGKLTFSFQSRDINLAKKEKFYEEHIPDPEEEEFVDNIKEQVEREWQKELQKPADKISLRKCFFRYCNCKDTNKQNLPKMKKIQIHNNRFVFVLHIFMQYNRSICFRFHVFFFC